MKRFFGEDRNPRSGMNISNPAVNRIIIPNQVWFILILQWWGFMIVWVWSTVLGLPHYCGPPCFQVIF